MAEAVQGAAGPTGGSVLGNTNQSSQPQPGTGGGFQVPTGHRLVSESDWAVAERNRESAAGAKSMHERMKKLGFEKFDDIEAFGPALQTMRSRKIDPALFARSFEPEAQEGSKPETPAFDPAKFKAETMAEWRKEQAEGQWKSEAQKEKELFAAARAEIKSEFPDVPDFLLDDAIYGRAEQLREFYEDGHPLKDQFLKPHNDGFKAKLSEYYKAEKAKAAGAAMNSKGEAALKPKTKSPTTAGNPGGQGKPKDEPEHRSADTVISDFTSKFMANRQG